MQEIIFRIKNGEADLLPVLWDLTKGYIHRAAVKRHREASGRGSLDRHGAEIADYEQAGFIALSKAVAKYDPEKGAFLTYLSYCLKTEFDTAAGRRGAKAKDPLHTAERLEEIVDDEVELLDLIPAPEDTEETATDHVFRDGLRERLDDLIQQLPKAEAEEIRAAFLEEKSVRERADETGNPVDLIRKRRIRGLQNLRAVMNHSRAGAALRKYLDNTTNFASYVGVQQFQNTRTSAVEMLVLERQRRMDRLTRETQKTEYTE